MWKNIISYKITNLILHRSRYLVPSSPSFLRYAFSLKGIWNDKFFTNNGKQFNIFNKELKEFLKTNSIGITSSGTLAEECILSLNKIEGKNEIITTSYSFIATSNAIIRSGLKPIFVDIDNDFSLNIDQIRNSITEKTLAILPVDVYGIPNNLTAIKEVIGKRNIKLIIDKSHAFGVKINSKSSICEGDFSFASMHATKVMSAVEAGLIYSKEKDFINRFNNYCNFGFNGNDSESFGTNAKIDELRCLFGRYNLASFEKRRIQRKKIYDKYLYHGLSKFIPKALKVFEKNHTWNYSYLPILLPRKKRNFIYEKLLDKKIITKKYFEKIIPHFSIYKNNETLFESKKTLDKSELIADSVLTLPLYPSVSRATIKEIIRTLKEIDLSEDKEICKFL